MYAGTQLVKHRNYAGRVCARCQGHKLEHLAPTTTIGLLLQYFISKPKKKCTGETVYYILLIMFMMFMICNSCL